MKFLLLAFVLNFANLAWAEKMHGEFASDKFKKCQSLENCTTCLAASGCDMIISPNMSKNVATKNGNSNSKGKASGLGQ